MKLSTRSRYGTRMLLDMAQHYNQGPVQLGDIAKRQNVSLKYLEQIIIPLKKAHYVESVRGPKGGHLLAKPPEQISVGEIVALLEEGTSLVECTEHAEICERSHNCPTRMIWREAAQVMFDRLKAISLADLVERARAGQSQEIGEILNHPAIPVFEGKR
jgi:Rrf2 family transcriptional regulator, iron-sulfur cluster assembly transcription factor